MTVRVGTFALNNKNFNNIFRSMQTMSDLQIQLSTGVKGQRYEAFGADASRLVNLETTGSRIKQYMKNIDVVDRRLSLMENSTQQIMDVAQSMKVTLTQALSNEQYNVLPLTNMANDQLSIVTASLNLQDDEGRYLFGGAKTNVPPVDLTAFTTPASGGSPNTEYYQGDSNILSVQADKALSYNYGLLATDGAYEKVIRALRVVSTSPTSPGELTAALTDLNSAITDLSSKIADIGANGAALEKARLGHENNDQTISESIAEIENVDVPTAVAELSQRETMLNGAFLSTTRLTKLSLLNFLN